MENGRKNREDNKGILTGKFFEYLGMKRTIFAIGPIDSDVSIIINETNSGKIYDYADIEGIVNFVNNYNFKNIYWKDI